MGSGHSVIPPSSAARRVQCSGSAIMELMYPDSGESDDAREGVASHELAASMVESLARGGANFPAPADAVGVCASNGWPWDRDSYEGALMYADDVRTVMQRTGVFTPSVEERVDISCIHPESWGTSDCSLYDARGETLYVWDYKYGRKVVEAPNNCQMIEYTAGILDALGVDGIADQTTKVVMTVVQPRAPHRAGPVRRWEVLASDLRGHINQLVDVEAAALSGSPTTCTGSECTHCSARHVCDTLQQAATNALDYLGLPTPAPLDADSLSIELRMLRDALTLIKARTTGLEAQAEGIIESGGAVPGYLMASGKGRQRWSLLPAEVFGMGDVLGIDLRKPQEPLTPKQAVLAGIDSSIIKRYSSTPSTAPKLVESTETIAHAIFAKKGQ